MPRFNMPFELGLAVAVAKRSEQSVLESQAFRLQQSLSDLNGYDPYIHGGSPTGMYEAVCNVFSANQPFPVSSLRGFRQAYRELRAFRGRQFSRGSIYTADRFARIVVAATEYVRFQADAEHAAG